MSVDRRLLAAACAGILFLGDAPVSAHGDGDGDHADASDDPQWSLFENVTISQAPPDYQYRAVIPANIVALQGRELTISGYAISLEQDASTDHFLLSRYSPECPYHAASRPNQMIEVRLKTSERLPLGREIRVTGRFGLQQNGHAGLFFHLEAGRQS